LDQQGNVLFERSLDLSAVAKKEAPNVPLESGDRLVVMAKSDLRRDYRASVVGEVRYPGTYPISRDKTKLSEFIERVGGFTDRASLRRAFVSRQPPSTGSASLDSLYRVRGRRADTDDAFFSTESSIRSRREIVNVDFLRLFDQSDSTAEIYLKPEDTVYVPSMLNTVYVFGEIARPGYVRFEAGKSFRYYLMAAGGCLDLADESSIQIVKSNTQQWLNTDQTTVEDGDYIWVPKAQDRPFGFYLMTVSQVASVLSIAITTLFVAMTLKK
jgi:protein involved in polysaccharide export with SLBB domain